MAMGPASETRTSEVLDTRVISQRCRRRPFGHLCPAQRAGRGYVQMRTWSAEPVEFLGKDPAAAPSVGTITAAPSCARPTERWTSSRTECSGLAAGG